MGAGLKTVALIFHLQSIPVTLSIYPSRQLLMYMVSSVSPIPQQLSAWPCEILLEFLPTAQHCKASTNSGALGQSSDNRHCDQAWFSASQTHLRTGVLVLQLVICPMIAVAKGHENEIFRERSWLLTLRDLIKATTEFQTQSHFPVVKE